MDSSDDDHVSVVVGHEEKTKYNGQIPETPK